jgi:hypothetical protein
MKTQLVRLLVASLAFLATNVSATVHYVNLNSTNPVSPYTSWATAATNIQDAVDASSDGDQIVVTNGIYATGGRVVYGSLTNRVVINKAVTVQSVNGPAVTVIQGNQPIGDNAVRCVYMTNNATLIGFTLTNGATLSGYEDYGINFGGGLYCESADVTVSNCVITGCAASDSGGGVQGGTLNNCFLIGNQSYNAGGVFACILTNSVLIGNSSSFGGGASSSLLVGCTLATNSSSWYGLGGGGGAYYSTLINCTLVANSSDNGGGAYGDWWSPSILENCLLYNNSATGNGGGVETCILTNCTLIGNSASNGGGADGGSLNSCLLSGNSVGGNGGGANNSTAGDCIFIGNSALYGGGAGACSLSNCTLVANGASYGGGADSSDLNSCMVISNSVNATGAGAFDSTLNNCTVWGNTASDGTGGIEGSAADNCIIFGNDPANHFLSSLDYCCTLPLPDNGSGNFTSDPVLVDPSGGDFHLQSNSPCINSGNNTYVTTATDLDGNPRIVGSTVDIGAYEYQTPTSIISYAWLQQYGLPTDGSADYADTDGTGMNNWQKWIAGLNPTNTASVLVMLTLVSTNNPSGLVVSWQSVSGITYFLQGSTNLGMQTAFSTIQSNIVGQAGTTSYTDTNAVGSGPYFYRVGVQ